jgi:hypothetical protein
VAEQLKSRHATMTDVLPTLLKKSRAAALGGGRATRRAWTRGALLAVIEALSRSNLRSVG